VGIVPILYSSALTFRRSNGYPAIVRLRMPKR
jgi:hypothetical protein